MKDRQLVRISVDGIAMSAPAIIAALGDHADISDYFSSAEAALKWLLENLSIHIESVRHFAQ